MSNMPPYTQRMSSRVSFHAPQLAIQKPKGKIFAVPVTETFKQTPTSKTETRQISVNAVGILIDETPQTQFYGFAEHGSYMTVTQTAKGPEAHYYKTIHGFEQAHSEIASNPKYGSAAQQLINYAAANSAKNTMTII